MKQEIKTLKKAALFFFTMFFFFANSQNAFIENKGQFPLKVEAKIKLPSGALFIENELLRYAFYSAKDVASIHSLEKKERRVNAHSYTVHFIKSNKNIISQFSNESNYYENYYIGERSNWTSNVKTHKTFLQKNIYSGIDIKYYIEEDNLKYDFLIQAQALPEQIKIQYKGLKGLEIKNGNIYLETSVNNITESIPYAYQIINGEEVEVVCKYKLNNNIISFEFPNGYQPNYPLVIDPVLEFSTYSGSTADNFGYTATYDDFGFLYSGSTSFGVGYPTTIGAYQINYMNSSGGTDIAITKYDTTGTQRIYSTYLGGSLDELPHSMIVNSLNELFIYGTTGSSDFPTTASSYQPGFNGGIGFAPLGIGVTFPDGSDIFVSRLSADGGNLLASTFIGGTGNDGLNTASKLRYNYADEVRGEIDIDNNNNIYIATCTQSSDFPTTNSFQLSSEGNQEGCIVKMDNNLTSIIWSSYLGGSNDDAIYSLALDDNNDIYVTGGTSSFDFPTTLNSYQNNYQDSIGADGFITKISENGIKILSSSYFGTEKYDQSYFVEIGEENKIYLFGQTRATGAQLVNNAAYSVSGGGQFIAILDSQLENIIRSTVVGSGKSTPDISPTAFLVDVCGKIYLAGWGSNLGGPLSTLNLIVTSNAFQETTDGNDFYLMVLDETLSTVSYATYFGGSQSSEHVDGGTSRFDKRGIIYQSVCAGCGGNSDFPIEPDPGAVSSINNSSNCNNGVFKFNFDFPILLADFNSPGAICDTNISFQNLTSTNPNTSYIWDFGDGTISTTISPTHHYAQKGLFNVTLIALDSSSCNITDTVIKPIYIHSNSLDTLSNILKCFDEKKQIGLFPINNSTITYDWTPSLNLSSDNISNPFTDTEVDQQYQLLISNGFCIDTLLQNIVITDLQLDAGEDTIYCSDPIFLTATYSNKVTSIHWSSSNNFNDTLSLDSVIIVATPQYFYVKASNGYCEQIDSVLVQTAGLEIDLLSNNICKGESAKIEVINLNPSTPIISYEWDITNENTNIFIDTPDSSRWYFVEAVNENQCIAKDSVFVLVYLPLVIDSIWTNTNQFYSGVSDYIYIYSDSITDSVLIHPEESSWHFIELETEQGCIVKDSIWVEVIEIICSEKKFIIPTGFTPFTSPGVNDTYYIKELDSGIIDEFLLEIFNRNGQKVFATKSIYEEWDGTFKNEHLAPQVFDFYLKIRCVGNSEFLYKGNITLIR